MGTPPKVEPWNLCDDFQVLVRPSYVLSGAAMASGDQRWWLGRLPEDRCCGLSRPSCGHLQVHHWCQGHQIFNIIFVTDSYKMVANGKKQHILQSCSWTVRDEFLSRLILRTTGDWIKWIPSRELTYPPKMAFWRWLSLSQGGIC